MRAKCLKSGVGAFAALFVVTIFAWDQDSVRDDPSDDLITPWCRIGSPDSWEGRPCLVPLEGRAAGAAAVPH
jgi:hypothetical protein